MSSFLGHAAAGAAIYLSRNRLRAPQVRWTLPVLVLLAMSPDVDYLFLWLFQAQAAVRITHSLLFCFGIGVIAWVATSAWRRKAPDAVSFAMVLLASGSHLLLDLLVGVHPLPLLWPLVSNEWSSPVGLLPSAGHLRLGNPYLWRNLLIELGVLLPILAAGVALARGMPLRRMARPILWLLPVWGALLAWSMSLTR